MVELNKNQSPYYINNNIDLIFSPDDENSWYFQDFKNDKTSQLFKSGKEAVRCRNSGKLAWS